MENTMGWREGPTSCAAVHGGVGTCTEGLLGFVWHPGYLVIAASCGRLSGSNAFAIGSVVPGLYGG